MSEDNHDLWGSSKERVPKACEEIFGNKKYRKCNVNTWWWNSVVENEIQKKKEAYKYIMKNPTEETQNECR